MTALDMATPQSFVRVRLVVAMGMRMHERAMPVLVGMQVTRRIESAVGVSVRLFLGKQWGGVSARFHDPDRGGDSGEHSEKDPRRLTEAQTRCEEARQRIGEAPSRMAEGEMRGVNVPNK